MATCRKVLVRKTVTTNTRIERSVASPGSAWATVLGPGAPEGVFHFEPEKQGTEPEHHKFYDGTEYRLELSEAEAKVLSNLFDLSDPILNSSTGRPGLKPCRDISEALRDVLYEGKDFATRRAKGFSEPWIEWKHKPVTVQEMDVENKPLTVLQDTVTVEIPRELLDDESVELRSYIRTKLAKYGPDNPQYINGG